MPQRRCILIHALSADTDCTSCWDKKKVCQIIIFLMDEAVTTCVLTLQSFHFQTYRKKVNYGLRGQAFINGQSLML